MEISNLTEVILQFLFSRTEHKLQFNTTYKIDI